MIQRPEAEPRAKVRVFRVSLLSSSFVIRVSFYFQERERLILSVTPMYLPLLCWLIKVFFYFVYYSCVLLFLLFSISFSL